MGTPKTPTPRYSPGLDRISDRPGNFANFLGLDGVHVARKTRLLLFREAVPDKGAAPLILEMWNREVPA